MLPDSLSKYIGHSVQQQVATASSSQSSSNKIIYLGEVVSNIDSSKMGRIKVRLVTKDEKNNIIVAGKDKDNPEAIEEGVVAFPLIPDFFSSIPEPGELVYILFANPTKPDNDRYYIGPIRSIKNPTTKSELASSSVRLFNSSSFNGEKGAQSENSSTVDNNEKYIYIKGKEDSDIIFKSREVLIRAGAFDENSANFSLNENTKCYIQMRQTSTTLPPEGIVPSRQKDWSQTNIVGSNINLISSDSDGAKNRTLNPDGSLLLPNIEAETNSNLEIYGEEAKKLHPLVLGDELEKLLQLIIRFCLQHIHQPQSPVSPEFDEVDYVSELKSYQDATVMAKILSNSVRTN
tara:strand:- start:6805 stop:7845 length:1041 start_codon:yes stop_codon:yes gene_type:complete